MRRLRYSVPYIAGKNLPKDSDSAPCGAGQDNLVPPPSYPPFQSTRPLRGGTAGWHHGRNDGPISIHPPCGAGPCHSDCRQSQPPFQSTRPLRGGTSRWAILLPDWIFQSTRPLRGGTQAVNEYNTVYRFQSTRPLRGGTASTATSGYARLFQSTRPLRGGTFSHAPADIVRSISIHPPLAGRDTSLFVGFAFCSDFNPPAPCGAGPLIRYWAQMEMQFQSTRPLRGGALPSHCNAGRDMVATAAQGQRAYFNPPAPCGAGLIRKRVRILI